MKNVVEVVAALIRDGDKLLICQRPVHKDQGGLWEFPGGKVERGETQSEALVRECQEELGIEVEVLGLFQEVLHQYPEKKIHLSLYTCKLGKNEPVLLEHQDLVWITPTELSNFEFCPADIPFISTLAAENRSL